MGRRPRPVPHRRRGRGDRGAAPEPSAPTPSRQVRPRRRHRRRPSGAVRRSDRRTQDRRSARSKSIRLLQVARRSAMKARSQAANQIHAVIATAPEQLRRSLAGLDTDRLVERCARFRRSAIDDPAGAAKHTLMVLARRWQSLNAEIAELDDHLDDSPPSCAPTLVALNGVGTQTASALLAATGDNPDRLDHRSLVRRALRSLTARRLVRSTTTSPAQPRRRPPRQRRALHRRHQPAPLAPRHPGLHGPPTRRRKTHKEVIRCLKRYVAREVHRAILTDLAPPQRVEAPAQLAA